MLNSNFNWSKCLHSRTPQAYSLLAFIAHTRSKAGGLFTAGMASQGQTGAWGNPGDQLPCAGPARTHSTLIHIKRSQTPQLTLGLEGLGFLHN